MVKIKGSFFKLQKAFLIFLGSLLILGLGCTNNPDNKEAIANQEDKYIDYVSSIKTWQQNRIKGLKKNWLSLAGLYELQEGKNTFGAHQSNDFVFPNPNTPDHMGAFTLENGEVSIKINTDVMVTYNDDVITEMTLMDDQSGSPTVLQSGSLSWYIIKRVEKIYVRLRDSENPDIDKLSKIDNFPLDTMWRLKAQYEPHMTPKIIETITTSGNPSRITSSGA
jgi:uncharacterized protein (DUF1684 family)